MDKWLNQLFMLLKSPVGEAEIPDVKPPLSVVDSQELGFFFTSVPYTLRSWRRVTSSGNPKGRSPVTARRVNALRCGTAFTIDI
jgi:hypothetical protein